MEALRIVSLFVAVASCEAATTTSDAGSKDATSGVDACFAYCQANGFVGIQIGCGHLVDASTFGACAPVADAAAMVCPDDASAPYVCVARATTTGTCGVSLAFEDGGVFDGSTMITETPPGCCGGILVATPSIIGTLPCDAGVD